jgi:hypothetical protein
MFGGSIGGYRTFGIDQKHGELAIMATLGSSSELVKGLLTASACDDPQAAA